MAAPTSGLGHCTQAHSAAACAYFCSQGVDEHCREAKAHECSRHVCRPRQAGHCRQSGSPPSGLRGLRWTDPGGRTGPWCPQTPACHPAQAGSDEKDALFTRGGACGQALGFGWLVSAHEHGTRLDIPFTPLLAYAFNLLPQERQPLICWRAGPQGWLVTPCSLHDPPQMFPQPVWLMVARHE